MKITKILVLLLAAFLLLGACTSTTKSDQLPDNLSFTVSLKEAGNAAQEYELKAQLLNGKYLLKAEEEIPLELELVVNTNNALSKQLLINAKAKSTCAFNIKGVVDLGNVRYDDSYFYLPGFWYRKNLRSPENAVSNRVSKNWTVKEDRLSTPSVGVYDQKSKQSYTVYHVNEMKEEALKAYPKGEVIVHQKTDIGFVGFGDHNGTVYLSFGYPYSETPYTYIRKLTLDPPVTVFQKIDAGEEINLKWLLHEDQHDDYSDFMKDSWTNAYETYQPEQVQETYSDDRVKALLARYFEQSYTDTYQLKGFSGVHLHIDRCTKRGLLEVGFVGRNLLNAFNSAEFGYETGQEKYIEMAREIYKSYTEYGFTPNGFLREVVDFKYHHEPEIFSIRRQSEGLYAILQFLKLEKEKGNSYPVLEEKTRNLLRKVVALQDGNQFPRKFTDDGSVIDNAGGSTSTVIIPLLMGAKYFGDESYLKAAQKAGDYIEHTIIDQGDYFSSTLDANCEDKEASIYTASAMYYLGLVSEGELQQKYYTMAEKAAYFALSWYYLWDVPFAPGQMLGDLGFKTRGWGNVSVENNHVDVYIFDFADVLNNLSSIKNTPELAEFSAVIKSSMKDQLMPVEGRMCGIGKVGYYPEVVQHTNWDYGQFGKGYYNDIFAPGWTVASLWELLSTNRLRNYFQEND